MFKTGRGACSPVELSSRISGSCGRVICDRPNFSRLHAVTAVYGIHGRGCRVHPNKMRNILQHFICASTNEFEVKFGQEDERVRYTLENAGQIENAGEFKSV